MSFVVEKCNTINHKGRKGDAKNAKILMPFVAENKLRFWAWSVLFHLFEVCAAFGFIVL